MSYLYYEDGQLTGIVKDPERFREFLHIMATNVDLSVDEIADEVFRDSRYEELNTKKQGEYQWHALKTLINGNICPIVLSDELPEAVSAVYMSERKCILVNCCHSLQEVILGLVRETAYASLDGADSRTFNRQNNAFCAYAISYVIANKLGISPEVFTYDIPPKKITECGDDSVRLFFDLIRTKVKDICSDNSVQKNAKHKADCR